MNVQELVQLAGTVLWYGWIAFLAYVGIRHVWTSRDWIQAYKEINWKLYLYIIPLIALIIFVYYTLTTIHSVFTFSWISVLSSLAGNSNGGTNIGLAGTNIPFLGIVMCLLFMTQLPSAAQWEEEKFRDGTKNWLDGLKRSIAFGFVHMIVGVPLGAAIALIVTGLFFTAMYFRGGIRLSTQVHFQYNLLLVGILLLSAIAITIG